MGGYFPQQNSWPWMQGQQQNYGGGYMGQGGYGQGWGGGGYPQPQFAPQYGQYQPQAGQQASPAAQPQTTGEAFGARRAQINQHIGNLQEQWKAAGSQDQAGIQNQITGLQGRLQHVRNQFQDQRQQFRQASQPGAPAPAAAQTNTTGNYGGTAGANSQQAPAGGYTGGPGQGGAWSPQKLAAYGGGAPMQGPAPGSNPLANMYLPSNFNTQFGNLVEASGGNHNLYKQNGGDESQLYNYDPSKGWQQTQNYQNMSDQQAFSFADPNQYAKQAGGRNYAGAF